MGVVEAKTKTKAKVEFKGKVRPKARVESYVMMKA